MKVRSVFIPRCNSSKVWPGAFPQRVSFHREKNHHFLSHRRKERSTTDQQPTTNHLQKKNGENLKKTHRTHKPYDVASYKMSRMKT